MKILTSSYYLDRSGTPTYTLTMYNQLLRRGHQVLVYSPASGILEKEMNTVTRLEGVPSPDVIIAHQNVCAEDMRQKFPDVPMIFSAHGVEYDLEQPPKCNVQFYTAINEDGVKNLVSKRVDPKKIAILRDFVDTGRFAPNTEPSPKLNRVLFISNFKKWKTYEVISGACKKLGVELKAIGAPYGRSYFVEREINNADLVISIARGVIEAMSCGRPVISFNQMKGDGYLTRKVYYESRTRNFAGENCRYSFDVNSLAEEMRKYDPNDGIANRMLALNYHDHVKGVDQLLEIVGRVRNEDSTSVFRQHAC